MPLVVLVTTVVVVMIPFVSVEIAGVDEMVVLVVVLLGMDGQLLAGPTEPLPLDEDPET